MELSHRPRSCPHQVPAVAEAVVLELRRRHRYWGPRRIRSEMVRRRLVPARQLPSKSAVYRALVRAGLVEPLARRRRAERFKRWERAAPMELWQMDVVGGFLLADGSHAKALTGIDDSSRFCVSARLMPAERTRAVCDALAAALRVYGCPAQLLTDNGRVFTGRFNHPPVEVLRTALANHDRQDRAIPRREHPPGVELHPHRAVPRGGQLLAVGSPGAPVVEGDLLALLPSLRSGAGHPPSPRVSVIRLTSGGTQARCSP